MKLQIIGLLLLSAATVMAQPGEGGGKGKGKGKPPSPEEFIERLDTDGDGFVSEDEFDGPEEHFTEFDANGDGYISVDEVPEKPPARGRKER